jgi:hypothetical protein
MTLHEHATEALAIKAAALLQNGGGAVAAGSAAARYMGLTPDQWTIAGIIGGLVVAVLGLVLRTALDWYFRSQHLKLARERVGFPGDAP